MHSPTKKIYLFFDHHMLQQCPCVPGLKRIKRKVSYEQFITFFLCICAKVVQMRVSLRKAL